MNEFRIFVSSPGDVRREREAAMRVVNRLRAECAGHVEVSAYFWEHEPMHAGADFQRQIPLPGAFEVFVGILWSRLGTRLSSNYRRPDGSLYTSGTEFEFEKAIEAYRASSRHVPRLMIYRRTEIPTFPAEPETLREERNRQWDMLRSFLERWLQDREDGDAFKAAFNPYAHTAEFEERLEDHLRKLMRELYGEPAPEGRSEVPAPVWTAGSPYRGLKVFEFEHAPVFFGRTREVDQVVGQLRDRANDEGCPFVLIFGSSGSGKSSLLRAGILPLLAVGGVEGAGWCRRALLQPAQGRGDLFDGLAAALLEPAALPELRTKNRGAGELAAMLRESADGVGLLIAGTLPLLAEQDRQAELATLRQAAIDCRAEGRHADADHLEKSMGDLEAPEPRLLLGLDQLEEIFTHPERFTAENRVGFISAIASLAACRYVWIVATLRSDFFARCEELPELLTLKAGRGQYHLAPPQGHTLGQIIRLPAQAAGVCFEDDPIRGRLDDVLREAAAGDPGALPLLEFALEQLYAVGAPRRVLAHRDYEAMGGGGGLRGVLVQMAEDVYARLAPPASAAFAKFFSRLATVGPELPLRFLRRAAQRSAAGAGEGEQGLAAAFLEARLLVVDVDDGGMEILSVAHEALLNEWPRLRGLLEAEAGYLRLRARVVGSAAEWDREGRVAGRLATGLRLAEARAVLARDAAHLSAAERAYTAKSIQRSRRRMARTLAAAAALVVLLSGLTGLALLAAREARARKLETQQLLVLSEEDRAREDFSRDDAPRALVHLARAIEVEPTLATSAAERLWFALQQRTWPLPLTPPMRQAGGSIAAMFSPDGTRVLTASADGSAQVWDAATGLARGTEMRQARALYAARFSPDGRHVFTGCFDGTGQLWEAANGQPVPGWLARHDDSITVAAFSPRGEWVATGGRDARVRIWEVKSGKQAAELPHDENVHLLAFHPRDSARLLTVSGRWARLWSVPDGRLLFAKEHAEELHDAGFNADGTRFLTACEDGSVRQWNTEDGGLAAPILAHEGRVTRALFSPAGEAIAAVCDRRVFLWKATGEPLREEPLQHASPVHALQFHPAGARLITGCDDGRAQLWDVAGGFRVGEPIQAWSQVVAVAFSPDGRALLTASAGGESRLWATPQTPLAIERSLGTPLETLAVSLDGRAFAAATGHTVLLWNSLDLAAAPQRLEHADDTLAVAFSPNGQWILSGSATGEVQLWTRAGTRQGEPTRLGSAITTLAFSPQSSQAVAGAEHGETRCFSVPAMRPLASPPTRGDRVTAVAWSSDGQRAAVASLDGTVWFLSPVAGKEVAAQPGGKGVTAAAFSPHGSMLATGDAGGGVGLWNLADGTARQFRAGTGGRAITSISFDATGARLLTSSEDNTAVVWDVARQSPAGAAMQHSDFVLSAAFSADGRRVVTASEDGTARLWDAATGTPLCDPWGHPRSVRAARWLGEGRSLITASVDGTIAIHELPPAFSTEDRRALATMAEALSPVALQGTGRVAAREIEPLSALRRRVAATGAQRALADWMQRLLEPRDK